MYFPGTTAAAVSPAFEVGWADTTEALQRRLEHVKGSDTIAAGDTIDIVEDTADEDLDRQYVSDPMDAGLVFTNGVSTITLQIAMREFATTDNVDRCILGVRIVNNAGTVVQATLLAQANHATTAEFINNATMRNKQCANSDTITAGYTTASGDRLVVEIGYQSSTAANTSPQAAAKWGQNATDCPADESTTTDCAGWIETSVNLTFQTTGPANSGMMGFWGMLGGGQWVGWLRAPLALAF